MAAAAVALALLGTAISYALTVTNGMEAGWVLGQPNFETGYDPGDPNLGAANPPSASTMNIATAVIRDPAGGRFFLVDNGNRRVLIWNGLAPGATFNGTPANVVLGQQSFAGNAANVNCSGTPGIVSACGLDNPGSMWLDVPNNRLWVTDINNHRVLGWNLAGIATGDPANYVIGQGGFTTKTVNRDCADTGTTGAIPNACGLDSPAGVTGGNGMIIVADSDNYRVVFYSQSVIGLSSNKAAVGVLGETSLTTRTRTVTQSDLGYACDALWDGARSRLSVADCDVGANRVMVWENFNPASFSNGAPASKVLGQPDFTTGTAGAGASGLNGPTTFAACPSLGRFLVCDTYNNRVLVYDDATLTDGEGATAVIGQPDFASTAPTTSRTGLNFPIGVACDGAAGHIYVGDGVNHRVLVYGDHVGDDPLVVDNGTATTSGNTVTVTSTVGHTYTVALPSGTSPLSPNTSVIITAGTNVNHPSISISATLPAGQTKTVTIPWVANRDYCIDDQPGATVGTTQGGCTAAGQVKVDKQDINTIGECFFWEGSDTICRTDATTLTVTGLEHSALYAVSDEDDDGVDDDADVCPGTDLNGPVPTVSLKPNHMGDDVMIDGCNASQILTCLTNVTPANPEGEQKHGVSRGQQNIFTRRLDWAQDVSPADGTPDCFQ
jgi:hypothetical protein